MGTSLNGLTPANTYQALIKVGNNTNLNTTLKTLSDGAGNDLPMQASTTGINFTGTVSGVASGVSGAIQFSNGSAFASDATNLFWDDTNNRLGVGTNAPASQQEIKGNGNQLWITNSGDIYTYLKFSAQGGFASMIFGDGNGTVNYLNNYAGGMWASNKFAFGPSYFAPSGQVHIKGSGSTSATTSLLVQNSAGSTALTVYDNGIVSVAGTPAYGGYQFCASGVILAQTGFTTNDLFKGDRMVLGNTGGGTIVASAIIQADSTTKGFLPPRMTTTQKNAIASPATGLQVFDSTMNATCEYTGTAWRVVSAGAQAVTVTGLLQTVSLANGNVLDITLNSTTTFTFTNPTIGTYILKLTQGVGGGFLVNWPVNVIWSGGTAPTLSTTAGKIDIITLIYDGTSYYGNYSLNY